MRLYTIVEGQGEVAAVPVLLRRLLHDHAHCFGVQPAAPIRRKASEFRREQSVHAAVALAVSQPDCAGVLVLFDGEDDCPAEQGAQVRAWARAAARGVPCEVVVAYREYETWFLAALESLRGQCRIAHDAEAPLDPESWRDAKGALEEHMPRGASYAPTVHQGRLSATFDMALAYRRNRSFRKLTKAVGELLLQMQQPLADWPPAAWRA